jgi:hypothetical protein
MAKLPKFFENLSELAYGWSQLGLHNKIDK